MEISKCYECGDELPTGSLLCADTGEPADNCSRHREKVCPEAYCYTCYDFEVFPEIEEE